MPEVTVARSACPACGAALTWHPRAQRLGCGYCGTLLPEGTTLVPADAPAGVVEHDLVAALRDSTGSARGPGAGPREVKCSNCRAVSVFMDERVAQRCDFCGSPAIVAQEAQHDAILPQSLLPIRIDEPRVREVLRQWYGARWFAPNRLRRAALTDTLHGVYLPYWTFDARVRAQWHAEAGYYHYETEPYRDSSGSSATRQVRHVRWEPAAGRLEHFFDDELVPGTAGAHPRLLAGIEPFPTTTDLVPYAPEYLRGWTVERYRVDLQQAAARNLDALQAQTRALCAAQVPGDTHRNLQVQAEFGERRFKHVLVPVWIVAYDYGSRRFQVLVNGYTGRIAGEHPFSWVKIVLALLLVAFVVVVIAALQAR
jgi:ribosomal protein S27AE